MIDLHLNELKYRLMYIFLCYLINVLIIFTYHRNLISYLMPLHLIFTNLTEGFYLSIEFSLTLGLLLTIPYIYWHLYEFIIPGFYKYETISWLKLHEIVIYFLLFLYLFKKFLLILLDFFLQFESEYLTLALTFTHFLSFINNVLLLFILCFILINSLNYIYSLFIKNRKIYYFILILLIAIITPPDIFSLILIFIPLFILFELKFYYIILRTKI